MKTAISTNSSLAGKIIISTPSANPDSYFAKSVIYIVNHGKDGAVGLVVNRPIKDLPSNFRIQNSWDNNQSLVVDRIKSYVGGPVNTERGFVLHSNDYQKNVIDVNKSVCLSSNIDVLKDISVNKGPKQSLFLLGYCGWEANQLEEEIQDNAWLVVEQDLGLIFNTADAFKWDFAMQRLNITPAYYHSHNVGHC